MTNEYHIPVLLNESMEGLQVKPTGTYADATFGGGGHARAILQRLSTGRLIAFDRDEAAWANAPDDERLTPVKRDFRHLADGLRQAGAGPLDGLIADLGVSSHQFDTPARGFAFRLEGALDMRMDRQGAADAADILRTYSRDELKRLFQEYGELRQAGRVATAIDRARMTQPIETVNELVDLLKPLAPHGAENQFFARVFQALRIEVNDELGALGALLQQSAVALKTGGRLVVISYHSLEDRYVKHFIRAGNVEGHVEKDLYGHSATPFHAITRRPVTPTEAEMQANPRARSAKMRVAERN